MPVMALKMGMLLHIISGIEENVERHLEPVFDLVGVGIERQVGRNDPQYRGDVITAARTIGFGRARDHHVAAVQPYLLLGLAQRRIDGVPVAGVNLAAGKGDLSRMAAQPLRALEPVSAFS